LLVLGVLVERLVGWSSPVSLLERENSGERAADADAPPQSSLDAQKPAVSSVFCEADEGTRTLDLLHGKDAARKDRK
jgi:hypothetical protein